MDGLRVRGYEKGRTEEQRMHKIVRPGVWDHDKPSNPCKHGKIDVKLMMMMMMRKVVHKTSHEKPN